MAATSAPGFLSVHEHTARNPVARAIARVRLAELVRNFAIRLHLLNEGEPVAADGVAAARVLMVAFEVLVTQGRADGPEARVICGAISSIEQLSARAWRWHCRDATALDVALQRAAEITQAAPAVELRAAWARVDAVHGAPALAAALHH